MNEWNKELWFDWKKTTRSGKDEVRTKCGIQQLTTQTAITQSVDILQSLPASVIVARILLRTLGHFLRLSANLLKVLGWTARSFACRFPHIFARWTLHIILTRSTPSQNPCGAPILSHQRQIIFGTVIPIRKQNSFQETWVHERFIMRSEDKLP